MGYLLAILSGGLLALPFQFPKLALVSWVGLIPFLFALEKRTSKEAFLLGWLMGFIFFISSNKWLIHPLLKFSGYPWLVCALLVIVAFIIMGFYFAIFAWVTKSINNFLNISILIVIPVAWVGIEFLRTIFSFQFLFGFLGYSQAFIPELIQLAQYGGVYLVSFIIVIVNTIIYLGLKGQSKKERMSYFLVACLIFTLNYGYGRLKINNKRPIKKELEVGLVQPNIPQKIKMNPTKQGAITSKIINLSRELIVKEDPELLIWPETAILRSYDETKKFPFRFPDDTSLLVGGFDNQEGDYLNTAFLVNKNNKIITKYSKNKLVPWGEYVPYPNLVPNFIEINLNQITPGYKLQDFKLKNISWITPICSEILNPLYVQKLYQNNDLIINISNEAWFEKSKAPLQILQAAIFRAVEYQVPVIKVGNTGISSVINNQGQVLVRTKLFKTTSLSYNLKLTSKAITVYQKLGNLFGKIIFNCLLILTVITYTKYKRE